MSNMCKNKYWIRSSCILSYSDSDKQQILVCATIDDINKYDVTIDSKFRVKYK